MAAPHQPLQFQRLDQILAARYRSGQQIRMARDIFGQRGDDQIDPVFKRALVKRSQQRVVDHHDRPAALRLRNPARQVHQQIEINQGRGGVAWAFRCQQRNRTLGHRAFAGRPHVCFVAAIGIGFGVAAELGHDLVEQAVHARIERAAEHHPFAGPQIGQRGGGMRRHAAVVGERRLRPVNRRQPCFEHIKAGMAEPRIDMRRSPCFGAITIEIGAVHILGCLRRRIGEGGGHENRRLGAAQRVFRVPAVRDRQRFGMQRRVFAVSHGGQHNPVRGHNTSRQSGLPRPQPQASRVRGDSPG